MFANRLSEVCISSIVHGARSVDTTYHGALSWVAAHQQRQNISNSRRKKKKKKVHLHCRIECDSSFSRRLKVCETTRQRFTTPLPKLRSRVFPHTESNHSIIDIVVDIVVDTIFSLNFVCLAKGPSSRHGSRQHRCLNSTGLQFSPLPFLMVLFPF